MPLPITISNDYKPHSSGVYKFKTVKRGRQFHGEIREYNVKVAGAQLRIYWAARLPGEYIRENDSWAIDQDLISKLCGGYGISHIGILVTVDERRRVHDKSWIQYYWLTPMTTFLAKKVKWDYSHVKGTSPGAKGEYGSLQWRVPMEEFKWTALSVPVSIAAKSVRI